MLSSVIEHEKHCPPVVSRQQKLGIRRCGKEAHGGEMGSLTWTGLERGPGQRGTREGALTIHRILSHLHGSPCPPQRSAKLLKAPGAREKRWRAWPSFTPYFVNPCSGAQSRPQCSQRTERGPSLLQSLPGGCAWVSLSCQSLGRKQFRERLREKFLLIREHC